MKRIFSTILLFISVLALFANPVDEHQARSQALQFLQNNSKAGTRSGLDLKRAETGVTDTEDASIYVFNYDEGYVVISGNDLLPAVLGYGTGASFDAAHASPALKNLLIAYSMVAKSLTTPIISMPVHKDVAPLIETKWGQRAPFNLQCPMVKDADGNDVRAAVGCVATALAQIMYYHQWPANYDWDSMKLTYDQKDTGKAADAVAKLMADAGAAVYMEYGTTSYARDVDATEALRYTFGYDKAIDMAEREYFTAVAWDALLYQELQEKRPVYFSAGSVSSGQGLEGHAFILDGYQAKNELGYYHVNWGWYGMSDDYFLISVLNPDYQGTGGNAGSSGYTIGQTAIVGIQPSETTLEKTTRFQTTDFYVLDSKDTFVRSSASADFTISQTAFTVFNNSSPEVSRDYDVAIALYRGRDLVKIIKEISLKDLIGASINYGEGYHITSGSLVFGKGLADGTYQLRLLSREHGKTDWDWCRCATFHYLELTINGTKMTVETIGKDTETEYGKEYEKIKVNSVTLGEEKELGKPITITINLTNLNDISNQPIFLWGNASVEAGVDHYQLLGGGGCGLDPGATGDMVLEYTPQRAGQFKFYLATAHAGEAYENGTGHKLYEFEATVEGTALIMEMEVVGAKVNYTSPSEVVGTTLEGTVHLTNYGVETYNDKVGIFPFEVKDEQPYEVAQNVIKTCNIAVGESMDIPFKFENLTPNSTYVILVGIPDGEDIKWLNLVDGKIKFIHLFHMVEDTAIETIQAEEPDADVYDMRGVRVGKASELRNLPKGVYIINKKKVLNK